MAIYKTGSISIYSPYKDERNPRPGVTVTKFCVQLNSHGWEGEVEYDEEFKVEDIEWQERYGQKYPINYKDIEMAGSEWAFNNQDKFSEI